MQYEFKKFPIIPTVLTSLSILLAVIGIVSSLASNDFLYSGVIFIGLGLLVVTVLFLAGLTIGKVGLLKSIAILSSVATIVVNFILAIAKFETRQLTLFAIAILMLIVCVLNYIYYLTARNKRILTMLQVTSIILMVLTMTYAIVYICVNMEEYSAGGTTTIMYPYYFFLFSYTFLMGVPMTIQSSLSVKQEEPLNEEEVKEPQNEENL